MLITFSKIIGFASAKTVGECQIPIYFDEIVFKCIFHRTPLLVVYCMGREKYLT